MAISEVSVRLSPTTRLNYRRWLKALGQSPTLLSGRRIEELSASWADALEKEWRNALPPGIWEDHETAPTQDMCVLSKKDQWPVEILCGMAHVNGDVFHLRIGPGERGGLIATPEFCRQLARPNVQCEPAYIGERLTYEEMLAGVACRACGQPVMPIPGSTKPGRRKRWPIDSHRKQLDCRGGSWRVANSPFVHCARHCPPPPISAATAERIVRLLNSEPPVPARRKP